MRRRVALVLLGVFALICLRFAWVFAAWSFRAASVPLTFAALYLAVLVGVYRERAWARWIGLGLAMSVVLLQVILHRIGFTAEPSWLLLVLFPAALLGALGVNDAIPRPIRCTWFLAGATLLPVVFLGYDALYCTLDGGNADPIAVFAIALSLVGIFGLARSRTWGLLATSIGGLVLFFAMPSPPAWGGVVMLHTREVMRAIAFGLVCVFLPFALPVWRFLSRPD